MGYEKEHIRTWEAVEFRLEVYDLHRRREGSAHWMLGYEFFYRNKLIFEGEDFGCSPLHAVDSDYAVAGILDFLSLRPGDTDKDYFDDYTEEQMEFAVQEGENLALYAIMLEEGADRHAKDSQKTVSL